MEKLTREELVKQKESLTAQLKEVTDRIEKFDKIIYKDKFEKAIKLLDECFDHLCDSTIPIECPRCERIEDIDFDEVIDGLRVLYREEFGK